MTTSMDSLRERVARIVDDGFPFNQPNLIEPADGYFERRRKRALAKADAFLAALRDEGGEGNQGHAGRTAIAPGVDHWQPIETAPKGDSHGPPICVLLCWTNRKESGESTEHVGEGYWCWHDEGDGSWWWANLTPGDYYSSPIIESISGQLTHWMPLPAPPGSPAPGTPSSSQHDQANPSLPPSEGVLEDARSALELMIYETTHLSPLEDDGSHWCKISARALGSARIALAALQAATPAEPPAALVKLPTAFGEDGRAIGPEYQLAEPPEPLPLGDDAWERAVSAYDSHRAQFSGFPGSAGRAMAKAALKVAFAALSASRATAPDWNAEKRWPVGAGPHESLPPAPTSSSDKLGEWVTVPRVLASPMVEELTPTPEQWRVCVSVQDKYNLMKRRWAAAIALNPAPDPAGETL